MLKKLQGNKVQKTGFLKQFSRVLWVALILHLIGILSFKVFRNHLPDNDLQKPFITYVSTDLISNDVEFEEYAELFDSAPLFIPTRWSASQSVALSDFSEMPWEPFTDFEPQINLEQVFQPGDRPIVNAISISEPIDMLASRFWRFFDRFGELAESVTAFEDTSPVAEIYVIGQSESSSTLLPVDLDVSVRELVSQPVLYAIGIDAYGLISSMPTLIKTSGNVTFDQSISKWLQQPEVLAKLPEGYLRVRAFFW